MKTLGAAAGGYEGLLGLARAWPELVLADELMSHAFGRVRA